MNLCAVFWDVDGTLAETERDGHRVAFNSAFDHLGIDRHWDEVEYGQLLSVTGGAERLLHDMSCWRDPPPDDAQRINLARRIQGLKNDYYAELVRAGRIVLRPGVKAALDDFRQAGLLQAIVTTTSRANVDALLSVNLGGGWQTRFEAVVTGEDVQRKKPDPQAYRLALTQLRCDAAQAIAVEDSPAGMASAVAAGLPTIVVRSHYFPTFDVAPALAVVPDFVNFSSTILAHRSLFGVTPDKR